MALEHFSPLLIGVSDVTDEMQEEDLDFIGISVPY